MIETNLTALVLWLIGAMYVLGGITNTKAETGYSRLQIVLSYILFIIPCCLIAWPLLLGMKHQEKYN